MSEISEYERRITYALERIGKGLDGLSQASAAAEAPADSGEVEALREALEAERDSNAQLTERVRAIKEKQDSTVAALERRIEQQTRQLDVQGLELQRMKKTAIQLRESNRMLREAMERGVADPASLNKALAAELDALRASRAGEIAELDEILAELKPLIAEDADA